MAPTSSRLRDADAIQAQINVSVAQARRHIASWLPSDPEDGKEETPVLEKQDDFTPKPPRYIQAIPLHTEYHIDALLKA